MYHFFFFKGWRCSREIFLQLAYGPPEESRWAVSTASPTHHQQGPHRQAVGCRLPLWWGQWCTHSHQSVLSLSLSCSSVSCVWHFQKGGFWASTTPHIWVGLIYRVPGLFYPLCHTATWPHNTGKGPNCGHTGQDRQAQSLPVPHADALGLYSEATSPQLMYGLNSTPTGRQPFC